MKIGKKLFIALLGVGIFVLLIATVSSLWQFNLIRRDLAGQQRDQTAELTELNTELMANANAKMLTALAQNYADGLEGKFEAISVQVGAVKEYLEDSYASGQPVISRFPDDMVYLQPGVDMALVSGEFETIKSIRDVIAAVMEADSTIAMYYVSESGMLLAERYADYSGGREIDRRTRPWYVGAVQAGGIYWTPIYVDALSGEMTITCSVPVYGADDRVMGVIAGDILIDPLLEHILVSDTDLFEYVFLTDQFGEPFVGSIPDRTLADFVGADKSDRVIKALLARDSGAGIYEEDEVMAGFASIAATGWRIGIVLDYRQITAPQQELAGAISDSHEMFQENLSEKIMVSVIISGVVAFAVIVLVLVMSRQISHSITKPLEQLTLGVGQVSGGNLEYTIEIGTGDEIEALANAFNRMTKELKDYIKNLSLVTAERERIAAELDLATRIQSGMLPSIFPAFPDRDDIDVYAVMIPAKEVGGDFYDFFMIDENRLGLVIADVSGKGIPAALFMVITKTLLKNAAQQGSQAKDVLGSVNNQLVKNNDETMFVTAFIGILDIPSGVLQYASAGHNPPYLIENDGTVRMLEVKPCLMLAAFPDVVYDQREIVMETGCRLVLYTDGVTEAMSPDGELFGEARFEAAMRRAAGTTTRETLDSICDEVRGFETGAAADDLTMLIIKRT